MDWDILYKLCGSANKWSKGFVFSAKIWWQFFSCHMACSKYLTRFTTAPKYTLPQRLVFKSNQVRFLGFELHMMEQFGSCRPIRYWCYWLSEVIFAFQSEDILSYPSSVLTLIIRMHQLIDISNTWFHSSYSSGFLQIISRSKCNVKLLAICITMGVRKMWFDDLKKFASTERKQ